MPIHHFQFIQVESSGARAASALSSLSQLVYIFHLFSRFNYIAYNIPGWFLFLFPRTCLTISTVSTASFLCCLLRVFQLTVFAACASQSSNSSHQRLLLLVRRTVRVD